MSLVSSVKLIFNEFLKVMSQGIFLHIKMQPFHQVHYSSVLQACLPFNDNNVLISPACLIHTP